jgi:hypothetical protein
MLAAGVKSAPTRQLITGIAGTIFPLHADFLLAELDSKNRSANDANQLVHISRATPKCDELYRGEPTVGPASRKSALYGQPEHRNRLFKFGRLSRERGGSGGGLFDQGGVLLSHVVHLRDRYADMFDALRLLD